MTQKHKRNPKHFLWRMDGGIAIIQFNRPDRKNPLTFDSYAELRAYRAFVAKEKPVFKGN